MMNESEWHESDDVNVMLEFLHGKMSDRKLRLFACACCRSVWHLLEDERSRKAVEIEEAYVDGAVEEALRRSTARDAHNAAAELNSRPSVVGNERASQAVTLAATAAVEVLQDSSVHGVATSAELAARSTAKSVATARKHMARSNGEAGRPTAKRERTCQCQLLRDIVGNPFQAAIVDPSWLIAPVVESAKAIYEDRAFDRLPVLADDLEEGGCQDDNILAHCRHPGPHVRGCWVVDLLLGKD